MTKRSEESPREKDSRHENQRHQLASAVEMVYSNLDQHDAMTVTIVATDAFLAVTTATGGLSGGLVDARELPPEVMRGVVLMYDAMMRRVKPLLPRTPAMQHVFDAIDQVERVSAAIREASGMPPVE
ncbi:MAG: hypothetical protein DMF56_27035 [Acidobacteria bacterium]|nr:MAG: hypothetical protein DMF56_27035 [Acidobacteriota bacterium]